MANRRTPFFVLVFSLAASAFSQVIPPEKRPVLETPGDPPGHIGWQYATPGMNFQYGPFSIIQANVNGAGQNIAGDAANEPSITVDPTNPARMSIGWRQFNTVTSNFRQGGWAYSSDFGMHWTFPGVLQNNVFRSDPVLLADSNGKFLYLSLLTTFFDDTWGSLNGGASYALTGVNTSVTVGAVSATQTVGSTAGMVPGMILYFWTANVTRTVSSVPNATTVILTSSVTTVAAESVTTSASGGDKQWFTIDNGASSGHGFLYQNWSTAGNNYGGRQFSRSTNGGLTWSAPIFLPNPRPIWGVPDVASNGDLYISGCDGGSNFYCMKSTNAKNSAVTPTFSIVTVNMGGSIGISEAINPQGLMGQVWCCVDKSSGPTANNVYMLASVLPGVLGSDVMFVRSTNGGASFSAPVKVNTDSNPNSWHWFGTMSVAPNGRIDVTWLDTRADTVTHRWSQLYYSYSLDGGLTWSANTQVSPSFDPSLGYPQQNKMGDYMQSVSDNTGADMAFCATFNGEQDVYYVRLSPQPIEIQPSEFSFVLGSGVSGGLAQALSSDDLYLIGRPGAVFSNATPPLQVSFGCTSPTTNPQAIQFRLEGSATTTSLLQKVYLYNVQTSAYEELDARPTTTTDQIVIVSPSGSMSRFVDQTTKKVKGLVSYKQVAAVFVYPWNGKIDQALFTITP